MRKKVILLIFIVFIAITVIIIFESYYDISRTYTINQNDSGYEVVIRKYNGEIIVDEEIEVEPVIEVIGKNTLTLTLLAGNWYVTKFINVKDGRMSDYFGDVVAYSSDKVVYPIFEQGTMKIIVQDIYNRDNYYLEIIRDYITAATGREIISDVYFLDDETLYLTYFSGENYDKISEIIDLRDQ